MLLGRGCASLFPVVYCIFDRRGLFRSGNPREGGKRPMVGPGGLAADLLTPGGFPLVFHFSSGQVFLAMIDDLFSSQVLWLLLLSFLYGSIPFAWLIAKTKGIDLLRAGSGNPGATNLSRNLGRWYGVVGLSLDVTKGAAPIFFAQYSGMHSIQSLLIGAVAVLGHCFSPFLKGRGGKGVATTGGVLLALEPGIAVTMFAAWLLVRGLLGSVGMASVAAAVTGVLISISLLLWDDPVAPLLRTTDTIEGSRQILGGVLLALSCLVVVRHRSNIQEYRQMSRKESP